VAKRKKKLLLVDDNRVQLTLQQSILQGSGYEVFTATDIRNGIRAFQTKEPDAVVLDYEMPLGNGGVLAQYIRRNNADIPIIMFSGCTSVPPSALRDVDGFISKPAAPSTLIDAIEFWTIARGHEAVV
jgi:CheY-like chemotaxis protein